MFKVSKLFRVNDKECKIFKKGKVTLTEIVKSFYYFSGVFYYFCDVKLYKLLAKQKMLATLIYKLI